MHAAWDPAHAGAPRSAVRHVRIGEQQEGQRLDRALAQLLPAVPRSHLFRLIRRGEVRVNGRRAGPQQRLSCGDELRVPPLRDPAGGGAPACGPSPGQGRGAGAVPDALMARLERAVIHEDERLLVLDKPAGVAVHGGSGLSFGVIEALRASRPRQSLELAHRLDRDTSGCLLVAKRPSALRTLHALLREGRVDKRYLALVAGRWPSAKGRIEAPLRTDLRVGGERTVRVDARGKPAITKFRPLEHYGTLATLVEAQLETGRTHQIRVHAASCGHPVAGDEKYGAPEFDARLRRLGLTRMFLHASSCAFCWPDGTEQLFSAPLPPPLRRVLDRLAAPEEAAARTTRRA